MIKMSDQVEDKVSGFKGTVTGKCEYLNGCIQYLVKPRVGKDGKMIEGEWIDEQQLEIVITHRDFEYLDKAKMGGPQKKTPTQTARMK